MLLLSMSSGYLGVISVCSPILEHVEKIQCSLYLCFIFTYLFYNEVQQECCGSTIAD